MNDDRSAEGNVESLRDPARLKGWVTAVFPGSPPGRSKLRMRSGRALRTGLFFLAMALSIAGRAPMEAADTIAGWVVNAATGFPVQGADLDVFDISGGSVIITDVATGGPAVTAADGSFHIQLPGDGTYILRVDLATTAPLADRYFGDTILKSEATRILIGPGADVVGIDIAMVPGVPIRGSVSSAGSPLADIDIDIYEATTGEFLGSYPGRTDALGNYSIGAFPSGSYFVQADPDATAGQFYVSQFYGGSHEPVTAVPVTVETQAVEGIDFVLPTGGAISGTILSSGSGVPLEGVDLDLYSSTGERLTFNAHSTVDGSYVVGAVPPGQYVLRADPTIEQAYARSYFSSTNPGTDTFSEATVIEVADGRATTSIDFALLPAGSLGGTIRDASTSEVLVNIDVDVFDADGQRINAISRTDENGNFVIGPLPVGQYTVRADPDAGLGQFYVSRFYGGDHDSATAIPVLVETESVVRTDFALLAGGVIAGTITSEDSGVSLEGVDLDLFTAAGERLSFSASSALDGSYIIGPLPAGDYVLRADPTIEQGHARSYFSATHTGTDVLAEASLITVVQGAATANVDFALPLAGSISGTIRDAVTLQGLAGIDVDVFSADGSRILRLTLSDENGNYEVGPLPVGNYTLRADPNAAAGQLYVSQYYGGSLDPATAVSVAVGTEGLWEIDFDLSPGGAISGTILSGGSGTPLDGVDLDMFAADGTRMVFNANSTLDGSYIIGPLPAGDYVLRADPTIEQGHARSYFSTTSTGTDSFAEASLITVVQGATTANVDFSLPLAGSISGTIRDALTLQVLPNIDVDVFTADGTRIARVILTDGDGNYEFGPLPSGQYIVRADPSAADGYLRQYFEGQIDRSLATVVSVDASGPSTSGIDFALARGGWLFGTVRDSAGNPIANIDFDVFDSTTNERPGGNAGTAADGSFVFGPLAPGDYTVRCDPTIAQGYAVEYFDAKISKALADPVTVSEGVGTVVDFTLDLGGSFFGRVVSRYDGTPLAGIDLDVFDAPTGLRLDQSSKTDIDGYWSLGPLPIGTYIIRADVPPESPYADIYSGNERFYISAVSLSLAAGEDQMTETLQLPPDLVLPGSITLTSTSASTLNLFFNTAQGLIYTIEHAADLSEGVWQPIHSFTGSGLDQSYSPDEATVSAAGRGFFRVTVE